MNKLTVSENLDVRFYDHLSIQGHVDQIKKSKQRYIKKYTNSLFEQ